MLVYLGLANGLFLLRYALVRTVRLRDQLYWPLLVGLFVFAAFRWNVGCDWVGYWHQFFVAPGRSQELSVLGTRDGLWWWLMAQLSGWGLPFPWVNVMAGLFFFAGVHAMARRQPDRLAFLAFLFPVLIINMPMSGIRQGVAVGIMCFAFMAFIDRRPLRFAPLVFLASLFHSSALIFMLLLPLSGGNYSARRLLVGTFLAVPGLFLLMGTESAQLAATRYIDTGTDAAGAVFRVGILTLSGAYFLLFLRRAWRTAYPQDYSLAHLGSIMMIVLILVVSVSTVIGDRLAYYLVPIQAMIFARLPYLALPSARNIHVALPYVAMSVFFLAWTQASRHFRICYLPYDSWIFGMPARAYMPPPTFGILFGFE